MQLINSPLPVYYDNDGSPLTAGYLYLGTPNLNPETSPLPVYWDEAGTQPAAQPIRTQNGLPARNGVPAQIYAADDYSLSVRNRKGELVYYLRAVTGLSGLAALLTSPTGASEVGFSLSAVGAAARTVLSRLREEVFATDFFANGAAGALVDPTGVIDSTLGIQAAINAVTASKGTVRFPVGTFKITSPLRVPTGVTLAGSGVAGTVILKYTNTAGAGTATARAGVVTDTYVVDAVVQIVHANNVYATNVHIENLTLKKAAYAAGSYGIYAPRVDHVHVSGVHIENCGVGWSTFDSWMGELEDVTAQACGIAFEWKNDGTGFGAGTSTTLKNCWLNADNSVCEPVAGFDIFGLKYANLISCGCDNATRVDGTPTYAYKFNSSQGVVMSGCGTENGKGGVLLVASSSVTAIGLHASAMTGITAGTAATIFADTNSKLTLIGADIGVTTSPGVLFDWVIQNGSSVIEENPAQSPSGGNPFVSYSGGGSKIREAAGVISVTDALNQRYPVMATSPTARQNKNDAVVASAGAAIFSVTAPALNNQSAVVSLTVFGNDSSFQNGTVSQKVDFVFCRENGATFYENSGVISTILCGNLFTNPPTFSIGRVGDTWTVTMTPAHGDLVCNFAAEVQTPNSGTWTFAYA